MRIRLRPSAYHWWPNLRADGLSGSCQPDIELASVVSQLVPGGISILTKYWFPGGGPFHRTSVSSIAVE